MKRHAFDFLRIGLASIFVSFALLLLVATFVYRFRNPELTETQLFVKHWSWYLFVVLLFVGARVIFPKDNEL